MVARDLNEVLMLGLNVEDMLHRYQLDRYGKMRDVAKASAEVW